MEQHGESDSISSAQIIVLRRRTCVVFGLFIGCDQAMAQATPTPFTRRQIELRVGRNVVQCAASLTQSLNEGALSASLVAFKERPHNT